MNGDVVGCNAWPKDLVAPMRVVIGTWSAGDKGRKNATVKWAGGKTDYSKAPFSTYIWSVEAKSASKVETSSTMTKDQKNMPTDQENDNYFTALAESLWNRENLISNTTAPATTCPLLNQVKINTATSGNQTNSTTDKPSVDYQNGKTELGVSYSSAPTLKTSLWLLLPVLISALALA